MIFLYFQCGPTFFKTTVLQKPYWSQVSFTMDPLTNFLFGEVSVSLLLLATVFVPSPSFPISVMGHNINVLSLSYFFVLGLFLLFLAYATNTKPLVQIGPILFIFGFTPFFIFILGAYLMISNVTVAITFKVACTLLVLWGFWVLKTYIKERKKVILPSYPLVGSIPKILANLHRRHYFEAETIQKYGKTLFLSFGDMKNIWTADPKDVEYMLKTNQPNYEQGDGRKICFTDLLGDGIFNSDGNTWFQQRKSAAKEFSVSRFRDYMLLTFSEYATKVLQRLENAAVSGQVIDIQDLFFQYTFDSFGKLAFGVNVGCLDSDRPPPFAHAFDRANILTCSRFFDVFWPVKRLLGVGCEKELAAHIKTINNYVYSIIETRKKLCASDMDQREDFLSRFMAIKDENGKCPSDKYLRDMVVNFMLAGRDTTASGLSWTIFHVFQHPNVVQRARQEIFSIIGKRNTDDDLVKPSYNQLKEMSYLHATFSEALRLNPPVPADGKTARDHDVLPSGFEVEPGCMLSYLPFAMGRLPELWENPLEFRPERWLDEQGKFRRESLFKFCVFQAGPRQCLGMDFAYLEAKLILAMILQKYTISLTQPPEKHRESEGLTMSIADGLPVRVHKIP